MNSCGSNIGKEIKAFINGKGLKQVFISKKTGIPSYALNAILNGKRNIYAHEYISICKALGVPLDTFIADNGKPTTKNIG